MMLEPSWLQLTLGFLQAAESALGSAVEASPRSDLTDKIVTERFRVAELATELERELES